jgi:2',3'-cyclic-nucleotide 2'-phosphodiesterase (5'-nucleotidase family)
LTRRNIAKELPFRSRIVVIEVKGREIKAAMENGLSMIETSKGRFLHLSGAKAVFDSLAKPGERLRKLYIGGREVNNDKIYTIATSDYLSSGGDDFTMLKGAKVIELNTKVSPLLSEVVINHIRQQREITPTVEGRLVDIAREK